MTRCRRYIGCCPSCYPGPRYSRWRLCDDAGLFGTFGAMMAQLPMFALVVVALTLTGFVAASQLELEPVWAALAGAVLLGVHNLKRRDNTASGIARSVHLPFLVPNLTYVGSLANLLWRRILGGHRLPTNAAEFSFLGTSDGPIVHGARGAGVWAGIETFGT